MTTIHADFNALTEDRSICLTTRGSQDDIRKYQIHPGDWVWLSDGELVVGARVADDPRYHLVGIPSWETMVDFGDSTDALACFHELQALTQRSSIHTRAEWRRIFELSLQFEQSAPRQWLELSPGYQSYRRAVSLDFLGEPNLALLEIEAARAARPGEPNFEFFYLDLMRRVSPERAVVESEQLSSADDAGALVLVAAINILATHTEELPDDQFDAIGRRVLNLFERFENAPGRERISASLLSLVHFNRGLILLRSKQGVEARRSFELAQAIDPLDSSLDEAAHLVAYGEKAKEIASLVRSRPRAA
jgi:hypothetical protein